MFGTRESFLYLECQKCGCLQIADFPDDMARHYPPEYYAQQDEDTFPAVVHFLLRRRDRYAFTGRGWLDRWINSILANPALSSLSQIQLAPETRILDLGCGRGALLKSLQRLGFTHLEGADPFNADDLSYPGGLKIHKAELCDLAGKWDLIMLHHVFEHLAAPLKTLHDIYARLTPSGTCLIRIPLVSSQAWQDYGVDWGQLDAPRHFFLHTPESIRRLAATAGFTIREIVYDSNSFQFWSSELYRTDTPLQQVRGSRTFFKHFPLKTLHAYAKKAKKLNRLGRGDQAAFYLEKTA